MRGGGGGGGGGEPGNEANLVPRRNEATVRHVMLHCHKSYVLVCCAYSTVDTVDW